MWIQSGGQKVTNVTSLKQSSAQIHANKVGISTQHRHVHTVINQYLLNMHYYKIMSCHHH